MSKNLIANLKTLLQVPDLASKAWIYEQYDSKVMNNTIATKGDAAVVRIRDGKKAIAMTSDCTPRYVEADPFLGAIQAVAESYRNLSAVGARPLAITNCLNFGNPTKPAIMGQIVRAIQGITEACKALDYPVVSGNVSLYNETDGKSIQPTPAIGGVGLITDLNNICDSLFKASNDEIFLVGKVTGHLGSTLYEREILKIENRNPPPKVDLVCEKKNSQFVRELIAKKLINACHDVSDGGILVALFEMCTDQTGFIIEPNELDLSSALKSDLNRFFFSEDQSLYLIALNKTHAADLISLAKESEVELMKLGRVQQSKIEIAKEGSVATTELQKINRMILPAKLS